MNTTYVIFYDVYDDPVWGPQFCEVPHSGLVRVSRNRLRRAVFEWVGAPKFQFDLAEVKKRFPICRAVPQDEESLSIRYRTHAPLPDRKA